MALRKLTEDVNNVSKLTDYPSEQGMSAGALKECFDRGAAQIKDYLNNTLTEEVSAELNQLHGQLACDGEVLLRRGGMLTLRGKELAEKESYFGLSTEGEFGFFVPQGVQGPPGERGPQGLGLPAGGAAGQVLVKASPTDYDTAWLEPSSTGGDGLPAGAIIMWGGQMAAIPAGWHLCDGTAGTPDLRDRFVVGAGGTYAPADSGGSATVTLTTAQMPAHTHALSLGASAAGAHSHSFSSGSALSTGAHTHALAGSISSAGEHLHSAFTGVGTSGSMALFGRIMSNTIAGGELMNTMLEGEHTHTFSSASASSAGGHAHTVTGDISAAEEHTHSVTGEISLSGGGAALENRPPYYALCFIMKI